MRTINFYYTAPSLLLLVNQAYAFQIPVPGRRSSSSSLISPSRASDVDSLFGPRLDDGEDTVLYSDDDLESSDDSNWGAPSSSTPAEQPAKAKKRGLSRWANLNPAIKARIINEAHQRAIKAKKRREPAAVKKRRLYTQYREMNRQTKNDLHVRRTFPVNSKERTPLEEISPGDTFPGTVISVVKFGAYVDIGSDVDGLLHVSQISRDEFVAHPRQFLSPGDAVDVRVVRRDASLRKLQLTLLPEDVLREEKVLAPPPGVDEDDERIPLDDVEIDDELWGEIRRVTDYGAYVELGAVVRGFLHFMDHPRWERGALPREFMQVGDRVRVWAVDVDGTQRRIKLSANRPQGLPGPRREINWV